jgi:hypothetical protein
MENPGGSFNFAVGSLSAEVAMGGADTGANLAASGLSGLPMSGEPGGNAAGVGAGAAAGASFAESARVTWPNAFAPNNEMAAPTTNTRRPTELKNIDLPSMPQMKFEIRRLATFYQVSMASAIQPGRADDNRHGNLAANFLQYVAMMDGKSQRSARVGRTERIQAAIS